MSSHKHPKESVSRRELLAAGGGLAAMAAAGNASADARQDSSGDGRFHMTPTSKMQMPADPQHDSARGISTRVAPGTASTRSRPG